GVQRVGADLPGREDDGGPAGPIDTPLSHLRDERREFPLPRVDESQEEQEGRVSDDSKAKPTAEYGCVFGGMDSGVQWAGKETAPRPPAWSGGFLRCTIGAPSARAIPWSGCSPAEPASVSPGGSVIADLPGADKSK